MVADSQPLGVLVEHESIWRTPAVEESVSTREQVFQPASGTGAAEHSITRPSGLELVIIRINVGHVAAIRDLQHVLPAVRVVPSTEEEAAAFQVLLHHILQVFPITRVDSTDGSWALY